MPGEPILVVDDAPINLKLTRILLEHEGYDVRTAKCADEALQLLESFHPRLVLADIQMPGVDGLEMTRRIKQDPRNHDVLVVALTALALPGDEQRAIAAGCDGYITKPIHTRALAQRIRGYLHANGAAPDGNDPFATTDIDDLRARFLEEVREQVSILLKQLYEPFNAADLQTIAHQWVGTSGLLGYSRIGMLAQEAEAILRQKPLDVAELQDTLQALRDELEKPTFAAQESASAPLARPAADSPLVLIATDDAYLRAVGKALLENQSIECGTVTDGASALAEIRELQPDAVVLDVKMPGINACNLLESLRGEGSHVKVLLLTEDERPRAGGAIDSLAKPLNPLELVLRVKKLLDGRVPQPAPWEVKTTD